MFFIDRHADQKRRETQDRRAGKCTCGAQMQYAGGGTICISSKKPSGKCDRKPEGQVVQNFFRRTAPTANHQTG